MNTWTEKVSEAKWERTALSLPSPSSSSLAPLDWHNEVKASWHKAAPGGKWRHYYCVCLRACAWVCVLAITPQLHWAINYPFCNMASAETGRLSEHHCSLSGARRLGPQLQFSSPLIGSHLHVWLIQHLNCAFHDNNVKQTHTRAHTICRGEEKQLSWQIFKQEALWCPLCSGGPGRFTGSCLICCSGSEKQRIISVKMISTKDLIQ